MPLETKPDCDTKTAADFLDEVYGKQYDETALRRYLINKRQLTVSQVNSAFSIHRERQRVKAERQDEPKSLPSVPKVCRDSQNTDRPEKTLKESNQTHVSKPAFIAADKTYAGEKLIRDFLNAENLYCELLECLWREYYMKLSEMGFQRKIQLSSLKVKEIFERIPQLLKFHNTFYRDLKKGANIGQMFVRLLYFFKGYSEYMKSLTKILNLLGKHTGDEELGKCLSKIRKHSKFRPYDLTALLMVPLDRIMEYKLFLDNLLVMADKSNETYHYLVKAARRLGRVASWVKANRFVITNLHEIYRVQLYLRGQVNIMVDRRRIIRRGMIIRRTEGWTARNKQYVFFLFNDILLWTTRRGIFQNVVALDSCEVLPWEGISKFEKKKFKVVAKNKDRVKTLWLECRTERQKEAWFSALESAIENSHKIPHQAKADIPSTIFEDSEDEMANQPPEESSKNSLKIERMEKDTDVITAPVTPSTNSKRSYGKPNEEKHPDQDHEDLTYDFEISRNYSMHEFHGFDSFDDNCSTISESELKFFEDHGSYRKLRDASSVHNMSPFTKYSTKRHSQEILEESKLKCISSETTRQKPDNLKSHSSITLDSNQTMHTGAPSLTGSPIVVRRSLRTEQNSPAATPVGISSVTISLSELDLDG